MLQAGRVVGWCVLRSWDVARGVELAVETLVVTCELAKVGGWAWGRDGSLADS
jgi:hypothetical protein